MRGGVLLDYEAANLRGRNSFFPTGLTGLGKVAFGPIRRQLTICSHQSYCISDQVLNFRGGLVRRLTKHWRSSATGPEYSIADRRWDYYRHWSRSCHRL